VKKQLTRAVAIAAMLALVAAASAIAKPEVFRVGNLFLRNSGGIFPFKLPRHRQAPISARLNARFGTTDGTHPPAIKNVIANFDRTIHINARGLPVCRKGQLEDRLTAAARRACPDAIVGSGRGEVEVAFPDQAPITAKSPITIFNGGVRGRNTLMLIHAYLSVPVPVAVVVPVKITRIHRGVYGIRADARIPRITGGYGSVTHFNMTINRRFVFRRKKRSYLTASCPRGHYFAAGKVLLADGTSLRITHVFPCTPRG
jgi:hypothetical protein